MSWERGVFASLVMPDGCRVLDLCCGGGFFGYHFYSSRASSVVAVDFDPRAIAHARRNFTAPNVEFLCADIRSDMPNGPFDTIVWNAAIEHFTQAEITSLLIAIKARLSPNGILTGYTLVEKESGKAHPDHEYEFKSKQDLSDLLQPFFVNVAVLNTKWRDQLEERENLYFFASDRKNLPFGIPQTD
ncbi:MAG TPA: class I SAM-dependent methyltransferase [Stellaceae bacterium]